MIVLLEDQRFVNGSMQIWRCKPTRLGVVVVVEKLETSCLTRELVDRRVDAPAVRGSCPGITLVRVAVTTSRRAQMTNPTAHVSAFRVPMRNERFTACNVCLAKSGHQHDELGVIVSARRRRRHRARRARVAAELAVRPDSPAAGSGVVGRCQVRGAGCDRLSHRRHDGDELGVIVSARRSGSLLLLEAHAYVSGVVEYERLVFSPCLDRADRSSVVVVVACCTVWSVC